MCGGGAVWGRRVGFGGGGRVVGVEGQGVGGGGDRGGGWGGPAGGGGGGEGWGGGGGDRCVGVERMTGVGVEVMTGVWVFQAFWNWVENYPDEFTMLYQRPQTDMAGEWSTAHLKPLCHLALVTCHQVTSGL